MKHRSLFGAALLVGLLTTVGHSAQADLRTIYDNTSDFLSSGYTSGANSVVNGIRVTKMFADDIQFAAGSAGDKVDSFSWSVANFNSGTVAAAPAVYFFAADGTSGGPGTLLATYDFAKFSFTGGSVAIITASIAGAFTVPANLKIWAGMNVSNNGTTATSTQLNNFGPGVFGTPTVGSSTGSFFKATSATYNYPNNPAGSFGTATGSLGWKFQTNAPVPEPAFYQLSTLLLMGGGGALLRRRKSL